MHGEEEQQEFFMQRALVLAEQGRLTAPPNPWVGCLLVQNNNIVGEGYHVAPGQPHAEVIALEEAQERAHGATCYVTLEPCAHYGRTPPCIDALIGAGVKKVVIPFLDPDPRVSGQGVAALKAAGIEVVMGVGAEAVMRSLAPYLKHRKTGLPYCVLKAAISCDGKIAAYDGSSRWITGERARADVHLLRASSGAILVGAQTALKDHPQLTVRGIIPPPRLPPLRVLLDATGRVPPQGPLFEKQEEFPTLLFTTKAAPSHLLQLWQEKGVEVLVAPSTPQGVDLHFVLEVLGKRNVLQLLIEGGAQVYRTFFEHHLVDRLILYMGRRLIGAQGLSFYDLNQPTPLSQAPLLELQEVQRLDQDVRLDYRFLHKENA